MSSSEILQEYLVKIGYQTDAISYVKFSDSLGRVTKKALNVSTAVAGIAAATSAAVTSFSYNMRKMYFASELAGSSVKNMRAMEYAGKQIGVSGDAMASSIHGMAQALRLEPGLKAFLEGMGVQVQGRDISDVMVDFVGALNKMPEYQAAQIANMFGISADDYHQMATHLDELKAKKMEHLEIQKQMGVDIDAQKNAVKEYTQMMDKFGEQVEAVGDKIMIKLLPAFRDASKYADSWMQGLSYGIDNIESEWDEYLDKMLGKEGAKKAGSMASGAADSVMDFFIKKGWSAEQAAGLAANVQAESGGNHTAVGDGGKAYGIAQWHPDRQKEFKRLFGKDIKKSSKEEQLEFMHYELTQGAEKSAGDRLKRTYGAAAAGSIVSEYYERPAARQEASRNRGAMAEQILGADKGQSGQVTIQQTNEYNINGSDSKQIADSVGDKQDRTWGNIVRRFNQVAQ